MKLRWAERNALIMILFILLPFAINQIGGLSSLAIGSVLCCVVYIVYIGLTGGLGSLKFNSISLKYTVIFLLLSVPSLYQSVVNSTILIYVLLVMIVLTTRISFDLISILNTRVFISFFVFLTALGLLFLLFKTEGVLLIGEPSYFANIYGATGILLLAVKASYKRLLFFLVFLLYFGLNAPNMTALLFAPLALVVFRPSPKLLLLLPVVLILSTEISEWKYFGPRLKFDEGGNLSSWLWYLNWQQVISDLESLKLIGHGIRGSISLTEVDFPLARMITKSYGDANLNAGTFWLARGVQTFGIIFIWPVLYILINIFLSFNGRIKKQFTIV